MRDLITQRTQADWVIPLDDSDLLDPDHVETVTRYAEDADIVYSWCRVYGGEPMNRLFNPKALMRANYIPATALIRKKLLEELGGFRFNNHWGLWLRALRAGAKFKCVPDVTWTYNMRNMVAYYSISDHGADQKFEELDALVRILEDKEFSTVLEIGTAKGGTLWAWSQIAQPDALLISVDLPGAAFDSGSAEDTDLLKKALHSQDLHLVRDDSHSDSTFKKVRSLLNGRKVDLLFIDADHTEQGVEQDYNTYKELLADKAVVVFHDITEHDQMFYPGCYVNKFWDRLEGNKLELIDRTDHDKPGGRWGGLGVLFST